MNGYALLILVFCTGLMIGCIIGYSCKATKEELKPNKFEEYNQRILNKEREEL